MPLFSYDVNFPGMKLAPDLPRVSKIEALILALLGSRERSGPELVAASGGRLKRDTLYVTLRRLVEKGCITSRKLTAEKDDRGAVLVYRATPLGIHLDQLVRILRQQDM